MILRRTFYKYAKCLVITVVIAFFVQILIAIKLFPSETHNVLNKNGQVLFSRPVERDITNRNKQLGHDRDSEVNHKNQQTNKPMTLRLEELDFKPMCDVKSREAISAIHRAKSQDCKQEIVNKSCLIQAGKFYPKHLPNRCLAKDMKYGKLLGCYVDEKEIRLLSGFYGNYIVTNSPTACLNICVQAGFPYAGVQYATECFCGDELPPSKAKTTDASCDMKCPGNSSEVCGGYFTMNIFETGLAKFVANTPKSFDDTQPSVRIVFLLTLSGRALRQVHRLLNALYRNNHYYYIHVDSRQDYLHRKLSALEKKFPNIKLASTRFPTIWGGASLLKMLLTSMKEILILNWKWDFVINLSESDFPVKSLESLEKFLTANKGLNFVKSHGREVQRFIKKQGLDKTFLECDTHMWRIGDRKLPSGIVVDGGSDWIALSSDFVSYVAGPPDDLLTGLNLIFEHTLLSAESYFHTVLRNSHYCKTYVDNNLHVTNWQRKLGCKCQYKHLVDWCGCSPNDFRIEDWPRILNTQDRQLFFARKFEPIINQKIITRVEQFIGFYDHHLIHNIEAYWQSIYNVDDLTSRSDDTLLTHAGSIIRRNSNILHEQGCVLKLGEVIEINSYSYADVYKGNLILHKSIINDDIEVFIETWYKPKTYLDINYENMYVCNIKVFKVSTDYDQKEFTFRNLANILGPLSEPVLLYQFAPPIEKQFENLTIIWFDPAGIIADIIDIRVDENNLTNFIQPSIKAPFLPGVWTVGLFERLSLIATTKFLITPLEYYFGKELSHQDTSVLHSGSQNLYKNYSHVKQLNVLQNQKDLQKISYLNVNRTNQELREWIDSLSIDFFSILGSCISFLSNAEISICGSYKFQYCSSSDWSSLSNDPKGTIGKLNDSTGRLVRV